MKTNRFGIAIGGKQRLCQAFEERVRREYLDELAVAADRSRKSAIEEKIQQEIKERMKRVASPGSLWSSH